MRLPVLYQIMPQQILSFKQDGEPVMPLNYLAFRNGKQWWQNLSVRWLRPERPALFDPLLI